MPTHVVVTCSKRKRRIGPAVRLSTIRAATVQERAEAWIEALEAHPGPSCPAGDLYLGEQWALLRQLRKDTADQDVQYWILSAGYGLVPFTAPTKNYAATFSRNHPDTVLDREVVSPTEDVVREWWLALSEWKGPAAGPRTLPALAADDPTAAILIAASPVYLRAVRDELRETSGYMVSPERLLVFSGGTDPDSEELPSVLSFDARLQSVLGGSLMALNVRVLAAVLRESRSPNCESAQVLLDEWMSNVPKASQPQRVAMEDAEVRKFINAALHEDEGLRWTPLLRRLRDEEGRACEQNRFRTIYQEVQRARGGANGKREA